jgi:hypothetical protein
VRKAARVVRGGARPPPLAHSARNIDSEQNHWTVTKTEEERSVRLVEAKAVGKQRSISGELIERVSLAHTATEHGTAKPLE